VLAGRSSGTATCEHSQELTLGLLEFKATGVFTKFMPSTAVWLSWRATSPIYPSMVSPKDPFLSLVYDRQGSQELIYCLGPLPSWQMLKNYFWYLDIIMFNIWHLCILPQWWLITPY